MLTSTPSICLSDVDGGKCNFITGLEEALLRGFISLIYNDRHVPSNRNYTINRTLKWRMRLTGHAARKKE